MSREDGKPWEDKDGATDVDGFLKAFEKDNNTFWRAEQGHVLNVLEEMIDRNKELKECLGKCVEALKYVQEVAELDNHMDTEGFNLMKDAIATTQRLMGEGSR